MRYPAIAVVLSLLGFFGPVVYASEDTITTRPLTEDPPPVTRAIQLETSPQAVRSVPSEVPAAREAGSSAQRTIPTAAQAVPTTQETTPSAPRVAPAPVSPSNPRVPSPPTAPGAPKATPPNAAAPVTQQVAPPAAEPPRPQQSPAFAPVRPESREQQRVLSPRTQPGRPAAGRISLNFDDADVFSVIQTVFGEILKVNYVVDQRVKGRVTFRSVAPVSLEQVLPVMETILRLNGVGIVEESGLYRVVPISDVAKEPAQVKFGREPEKVLIQGKSIIQVVPLVHVHSSETIKLITPFLTTTAVVIDLPNINYVILVDTDSNVKRLLTLINFFDGEQTRRKKPRVSVYNIQNGKAKDVAAILQQVLLSAKPPQTPAATVTQAQATGSATPGGPPSQPQAGHPSVQSAAGQQGGDMLVSPITKIIADEGLNALIILSTQEDYEFIRAAIEKIDVIPRQVLLEGVVAEVSLKDELKLGISWALQFNPGGMRGVLGGVEGTVGFNVPGATPTSTTGTGTFTFAGTVGGDFKTVIDMLATDSRAKLLAVPHVLVSDNKEARIQVGQQVPVVSSETFGSGTVAPQRTIQYKDIGIILKVKPRINEGGLVTLDITQEVSSYETIKLFDNEDYIILKKTETTTNLVVQDGNTIIIGGLIRDDITKSRSGIPFLSKIPVLGYLFGQTTDSEQRTELIILLTPRVIRTHADANAVTSDYVDSVTRTGKGKVKREELIKVKPEPPPPAGPQAGFPREEAERKDSEEQKSGAGRNGFPAPPERAE